MSSFLKVDIRLVIDDGRNSNQKTYFNLREIDDDLESLYQTRAKEWFPFSLTMKVPGLDPHQTVQVCFFYERTCKDSLVNQKRRKYCPGPIRTRSKNMQPAESTSSLVRTSFFEISLKSYRNIHLEFV